MAMPVQNLSKLVKLVTINIRRTYTMSQSTAFHGSDLEQVAQYYHLPQEEIICFSANVNPLGFPAKTAGLVCQNFSRLMTHYPDREYTGLKQAIGNYCHISPDHVLVGNGSTELISLLIQSSGRKRAVQIGPSYSEYERELNLAGISFTTWFPKKEHLFQPDTDDLLDFLTAHNADFLILCNPNNPTARALSTDEIADLLEGCLKSDIFVMIDETYAEFADREVSAMSLVSRFPNLMVIRGISKFFAAPGLRLGYGASGNRAFLDHVKTHQNPWSVNSVAAFAGEHLFCEEEFIVKTKALISGERTRMIQGLSGIPALRVYPSDSNFLLVEILDPSLTASGLFDCLIRQKLMIRDCSSFEGLGTQFFRFCLMLPEQNTALLQAVQEFFAKSR